MTTKATAATPIPTGALAKSQRSSTSKAPSALLSESALARRTMRRQSIRYELKANNGRYADGKRNVAQAKNAGDMPHPMHFVLLDPAQVKVFGPANDPETAKLLDLLSRVVTDPKTGKQREVTLLPVHWEEAKALVEKFPELEVVTDGEVYASASPRSLFYGTEDDELPTVLPDLEHYSVKTHLSAEAYKALGGLGGSRELNFNDVLMASVLTTAMERLKPHFTPLIEFQSEARSIAGRIGEGENAIEVGAIFRELPEVATVPGFALFSETTESLPHVPHLSSTVDVSGDDAPTEKPRILANDAMEYLMGKDLDVTREQAFQKLFVDPLLEVFFTMAAEGVSMELHPQNFSLHFDPETGRVDRVVIRDLHGMNYDASWRKRHGKPDVMSVKALKGAYPDITQADVDGYFMRDGKIRDRYLAPKIFTNTLDFFMGTFFYQLLNSTTPEPFDE
ncbi:MAG: hypothetical protein IPJ65_42385, partial [Archangiaceae bacterium]|nr:hypothetical protein [Archangiaceae bacterium]